MHLNKDYAMLLKTGRSIEKHTFRKEWEAAPIVAGCIVLAIILLLFCSIAKGEDWTNDEKIADAIFWAEGGYKTSHPYGILAHYKHTTPRQACINTIRHARKDWNGKGDFIEFLGNRYCPIGAKNDPKGLNKNWIKNVKYFLNNPKEIK